MPDDKRIRWVSRDQGSQSTVAMIKMFARKPHKDKWKAGAVYFIGDEVCCCSHDAFHATWNITIEPGTCRQWPEGTT